MSSVRFPKFSDNVTIQAIGSLFRKQGTQQWGINLGLSPEQEQHALMISNAPVLVRKRVLNPMHVLQSRGYRRSFTCADTRAWGYVKVGDYPARKMLPKIDCERDQWCFMFGVDSGITIYLPQFELARALFFHNGYLARTSIEADCLKVEFDILLSQDKSTATINVLDISSYPLHLYSNPEARKLLSWILIDSDARTSYESIGQYQKTEGVDRYGYRRWNFQFDPPPLKGSHFDVKGVFDPESKSLFVYEVLAIRAISVDVPSRILMFHPKFKSYATGDGGHGGVYGGRGVGEFDVYDDDANVNNEHYLLHAPAVDIGFTQLFETVKVIENEGVTAGRKLSEGGSEDNRLGVSVGEPDRAGDVPCADWDGVSGDEESDTGEEILSKFECFEKMLDYLELNSGCKVISREVTKFPALPRFKKHFMATDSTPRCIMVVKFQLNKCTYYMLEVDTSDSSTPLSTKVLLLNASELSDGERDSLMKAVLRNSLHWPAGVLDGLCGSSDFHVGVPHPNKAALNAADPAMFTHWAARLLQGAKSL